MMRATLGVILALVGASAMAVDFVNGGFSGNTDGWSVLDCDYGGYQGGAGQDGAPGYVWLNSNGTGTLPRIEQTVTGFTIGQVYTVSGFIVSHVYYNYGDPFLAKLDGAVVYRAPDYRLNSWTLFSFDFAATSTSHTFGFGDEVVYDSDYNIDSLKIETVPEPASLLALSIGAVALKLRRRK